MVVILDKMVSRRRVSITSLWSMSACGGDVQRSMKSWIRASLLTYLRLRGGGGTASVVSNGVTINDLEQPLTRFSRSRHFFDAEYLTNG